MLASLRSIFGRFVSWWRQELTGLMPGSLSAPRKHDLPAQILSVEGRGVRLISPRGGKDLSGDAAAGQIIALTEVGQHLATAKAGKAKPEIGLRLSYQTCFVRKVELPASASADFAQLLAIDLERATPFRIKDVYTAFTTDPVVGRSGRTTIRQLVIKRSVADGLISILESAGRKVSRLDCWDEQGATALPVNFLETTAVKSVAADRRSNVVPKLLGAAAASLAALAAFLMIDRSETALAELQAQTASFKSKVQATRDAAAKSQTMISEIENFRRLRSSIPSKVAALEELTRLLPDTAWVTDLKIDGSNVDIAGLATSAVTLIPILERSAFFVDATSTAPVTFDQREDKERFSIRVKIRSAAVAEVARSPEALK